MPRNGSGVFSLVGTYEAVTGQPIQAQQHNDPLEDLAADANAARPVVAGGTGADTAAGARTNLGVPGLSANNTLSGDNTFSGANTFSGTITSTGINTFSKIQKWAKGADVASANALTLGDDGNYFDITGTTAITSIATKGAGTVVKLHFDAALALTHHASDLILPGAVNITTAAGDEAEFVEYAAGNWRCTSYQRVTGDPLRVTFPPPSAFKNMVIKVDSNTTVAVTADFVTVTDGTFFQTLPVAQSVNFVTTGAGGLDAGSLAAGTWYYIFAIAKTDGTSSVLASTSATSPTMPSGYTYKARIGAVRTAAGSAQLMGTWQFGRQARYIVGLAQTTDLPSMTAGSTNGVWTAASVSSVVPTTASIIHLVFTKTGGSGAGYIAPNNSYGVAGAGAPYPPITSLNANGVSGQGSLMLETSNIYSTVSSGGGSMTPFGAGWEDNI